MPPPRSKKNGRHRKKKSTVSPSSTSRTTSFEISFTAARKFEESGQNEKAIATYEKLIEAQPRNVNLRDEVASLYMQIGNCELAEKHFRCAIELSPEKGFEKYAYLSQIIGNTEESLSLSRKGVELIQNELKEIDEQQNETEDLKERKNELLEYEASAHCAVAEIALGIIEDSNNPSIANKMDIQVEISIMSALAISESGSSSEIEATITLANLRLSQGRKNEARNCMEKILQFMSNSLQKLDNNNIMNSNHHSEQIIVDALENLPPMEVRIAIGKQLMEVELWNGAIHVLSSIMWECDFNVEVWYMLAVAYWKINELDEARNSLESARKLLNSSEGCDGQLEEELIDKLFKKIDSQCNNISPENNDDSKMKD